MQVRLNEFDSTPPVQNDIDIDANMASLLLQIAIHMPIQAFIWKTAV